MKFASKIQPFVSVTRQEANEIEMEQKMTQMLADKRLDAHTKSRLLEDGMARLSNAKQNAPLAAAAAAAAADPPPQAEVAVMRSPRSKKKKQKQQLASLKTARERSSTEEKKKKERSLKTARTQSSNEEKKMILQVDSPVVTKEKARDSYSNARKRNNFNRVDSPIVSPIASSPDPPAKVMPSYMAPIDRTAKRQRGTGGGKLRIKSW